MVMGSEPLIQQDQRNALTKQWLNVHFMGVFVGS
jgi:hypothetical protein